MPCIYSVLASWQRGNSDNMTATISPFQSINLALPLAMLRRHKKVLIATGMLFAAMAIILVLKIGWTTRYEALLRIEPELSTTGEQTSIEAEMDVIQSQATILETVRAMERSAIVSPSQPRMISNISFLLRMMQPPTIKPSGLIVPIDQFSVKLVKFKILPNQAQYANRPFTLRTLDSEHYQLFGPKNNLLLEGRVGVNEIAPLEDTDSKLEIRIDEISALRGNKFRITPVSDEAFAGHLQSGLKIARKGFRERSGLMEVGFVNADPFLAEQFLQQLVSVYLSKAYDRSARGKIKALEKLGAESVILRQRLNDAESALSAFRATNRMINISQEHAASYERLSRIEDELRRLNTKYADLGVSLTNSHPSMVSLASQIASLKQDRQNLQNHLMALPEQERQFGSLQMDVNIATEILGVNTKTIADLRSEVEIITGYASLISLNKGAKLSPVSQSIFAIVIGFILGSMIAACWVLLQMTYIFARVERAEDLKSITHIPLIAKLPAKQRASWLSFSNHGDPQSTRHRWVDKCATVIERLEQETQFLLASTERKVVLFTSFYHAQGSIFCARHYADASASKRRTLLIDANIMHPTLHKHYNFAPSPGLSDLLIGQATLKDALQSTPHSNLYIIPAGTQTANYRLLTDTVKLKALLNELSGAFDRIVIEFPLLAGALRQDNLLSFADGIFVTVKRGTRMQSFAKAIEDSGMDKYHASFLIFNRN